MDAGGDTDPATDPEETETTVGRKRKAQESTASASKCVHSELCQGITPSNSKGGLPAPEARARARKRER